MREAHALARWRESQTPRVSQPELGARLGVSKWTVTSIENGRREPSRELIAKIREVTRGAVGFEDFVPPVAMSASFTGAAAA